MRRPVGNPMPLVFPVLKILQKLWGGPPVRAGPPGPALRTEINLIQAGRPARGPAADRGVRPTIFADRPAMGKTSGIRFATGLLGVELRGSKSADKIGAQLSKLPHSEAN